MMLRHIVRQAKHVTIQTVFPVSTTATRSGETFLCWKLRRPIGNKETR
jgi:hypothetical protein